MKAPDQLSGHGISFVYTDPTTGEVYDRTLQVYWDLRTSGKYEFAYAATSLDDGLCHKRDLVCAPTHTLPLPFVVCRGQGPAGARRIKWPLQATFPSVLAEGYYVKRFLVPSTVELPY